MPLAERVGMALTGWVDRLPPRLRAIAPPDLVGFAILGGTTFLLDLGLLTLLRVTTTLPLGVAVTLAYLVAFAVNFVLNRTVNFRSHAPVGGQAAKYAAVLAVDYSLTLGVTTGLAALGLDYRLARMAAGMCVAAFTYSASRWWVFRAAATSSPGEDREQGDREVVVPALGGREQDGE
jgi:putative flippase GtrA